MELRVPYDKNIVLVHRALSRYSSGEPMFGRFNDNIHPEIEMLVVRTGTEIDYIVVETTPRDEHYRTYEVFETERHTGRMVTQEVLAQVQRVLRGR